MRLRWDGAGFLKDGALGYAGVIDLGAKQAYYTLAIALK
jgi:hypothetical protein